MALSYLPNPPPFNGEISSKYEPNVEVVQFGDGYSSRWVNGINAESNTITIRYESLNATERNTIVNFIKATYGARAFLIKFINDPAARKFICPGGVREVRSNGEFYDLELDLIEVFDLDS